MQFFTDHKIRGCFPLLTLSLVFVLSGCKANKTSSTELKTEDDKISYAIGVGIGKNLKQQQFNANTDLVAQGIQDALKDKVVLSADDIRNVMNDYQQRLRTQREAQIKALGEKNLKEGASFLSANKLKPGVQTTASGLQYQILNHGQGKTPKINDTVSLNFRATLIDNTEIDSSQKHGHPLTIPVKSAMPGWSEALQMMKEGDKWRLFVPTNLGFGSRAVNMQVGPNATLVFELELIAVNPPPPVNATLGGKPGLPPPLPPAFPPAAPAIH